MILEDLFCYFLRPWFFSIFSLQKLPVNIDCYGSKRGQHSCWEIRGPQQEQIKYTQNNAATYFTSHESGWKRHLCKKIPPTLLNPTPLFKKHATNHSSAALACASQTPKWELAGSKYNGKKTPQISLNGLIFVHQWKSLEWIKDLH